MPTPAALGAWPREPRTEVRHALPLPARAASRAAIQAERHPALAVPTEWPAHDHPQHELIWLRGGTLSARVGDRLFTIAEGSGLWLPAGVVHAGRVTAGVELHDAFFAPERTPPGFDGGARVIAMTPVLESLLDHLGRDDLDPGMRSRAEAVVFDVLEPGERRWELPLPGDARIDPIAEALLADPSDRRGLAEWAGELRLGERTITRVFRASTGLSFVQWRRAVRVHHAVALLAEGREVQVVSELLGYAQPSTFIEAFQAVMGRTPGAFTAGRRTVSAGEES